MVRQFIPQHEVLPWCQAVVCHGGSGTVLGALAHGLPVLVAPQGADQWSNAQLVAGAGAGRLLLGDEVTVESVRRDVMALLHTASYAVAARGIAAEIAVDAVAGRGVRRRRRVGVSPVTGAVGATPPLATAALS